MSFNQGITPAQYRALITVNCKNASRLLTYESQIARSKTFNAKYKHQYPPQTSADFQNVYVGEICWEPVSIPSRPRDQQPYARACLNGVFTEKYGNEKDGRSKPMEHRILGLSIKPVAWNPISAAFSDDPIIAFSGLMTTNNTGKHTMKAGEYVVVTKPAEDRTDQNGRDKDSNMSMQRVVYETTPLRELKDVIPDADAVRIMHLQLFNDLYHRMIYPYLHVIYQLLMAQHGNDLTAAQASLTGIINGAPTPPSKATTTPEIQMVKMINNMLVTDWVFKDVKIAANADQTTLPSHIAAMFKDLSPLAAIIMGHSSSKIIGTSQTSAVPKGLFDIVLQPCVVSTLAQMTSTLYYTSPSIDKSTSLPLFPSSSSAPAPLPSSSSYSSSSSYPSSSSTTKRFRGGGVSGKRDFDEEKEEY